MTNTAAVGGAGVSLALKLLNGETVDDRPPAQPAEHRPARRRSWSTTRPTRARRRSSPGSRSRARPDLAARPADRGLDDLHARAGRRLQGPGRVARLHRDIQRGDAGSAGVPRSHRSTHGGPMTVTATDLLLEATDVSKTYGAVVALQVGVARRAARRGPRADGRQRRRQEHARQDPDRRRPARRRHDRRPRPRAHRPLAGRGAPRRPRLRLPGAGAHPGPRHPRRTCA